MGHCESGRSLGFTTRVMWSSHDSLFGQRKADGCLNALLEEASNRYFPGLTIPRSKRPLPSVERTSTLTCLRCERYFRNSTREFANGADVGPVSLQSHEPDRLVQDLEELFRQQCGPQPQNRAPLGVFSLVNRLFDACAKRRHIRKRQYRAQHLTIASGVGGHPNQKRSIAVASIDAVGYSVSEHPRADLIEVLHSSKSIAQ